MSEKLGLKKRREQFFNGLDDNYNNTWAQVELHRWQYGHLPGEPGTDIKAEPLMPSVGMRAMAKAFADENNENWPAPFNVASVLTYAANLIDTYGPKPNQDQASDIQPAQQAGGEEIRPESGAGTREEIQGSEPPVLPASGGEAQSGHQ